MNAAHETVRRAFLATCAAPTRWLVRMLLALSRDPVAGPSNPRFLKVALCNDCEVDRDTGALLGEARFAQIARVRRWSKLFRHSVLAPSFT
jgi:hypothetical protein